MCGADTLIRLWSCTNAQTLFLCLSHFLRQWIIPSFAVPQNTHHPPALAVIQHLDAIDAALKRFSARRIARLITTEHLRDISITLRPVHDRILIKGLALKHAPRQLYEFI